MRSMFVLWEGQMNNHNMGWLSVIFLARESCCDCVYEHYLSLIFSIWEYVFGNIPMKNSSNVLGIGKNNNGMVNWCVNMCISQACFCHRYAVAELGILISSLVEMLLL